MCRGCDVCTDHLHQSNSITTLNVKVHILYVMPTMTVLHYHSQPHNHYGLVNWSIFHGDGSNCDRVTADAIPAGLR